MSTLIKDNGIWKEPEMIYVKDGGIWKEVGGGGFPPAPGPLVGEPYGGGYAINGYYYQVVGEGEMILAGGPGEYLYIIADKSAEASGLQWKTGMTTTVGTTSTSDGWANTNSMNNPTHPAAQYCRAYRGGGFDDWYLPAKDELNLFWLSLAPGKPTTPAIFRTGGAQALTVPTYYWSSTEGSATNAWSQRFSDGNQDNSTSGRGKTREMPVRPVRRLKI